MQPRCSILLTAICLGLLESGNAAMPINTCKNSQQLLAVRGTGWAPAVAGNFPWQVRLEAGELCGATIIGRRWVITAAHCLTDPYTNFVVSENDIIAHFGSLNISSQLPGERTVKVQNFTIHPQYNSASNDYDFALLFLAEPLEWSKTIQPACIVDDCDQERPPNTLCVVSGWGTDNYLSTTPQNQLHYGVIPLVTRELCQEPFSRSSDRTMKSVTITDRMICAGYSTGGIDTCRGDSGGPLICHGTSAGLFYLHGVTSFGNVHCGSPGFYGVYARVCKVSDWIYSNMNGQPSTTIPATSRTKKTTSRPRTTTTTTTEPPSTTTGDYSF